MDDYELIHRTYNTKNPELVRMLHMELLERTHRRYMERGVHFDPDKRSISVLKPPEDQAQEAGCAIYEFGPKVIALAMKPSGAPFEGSLFRRCFTYKEAAANAYDLAVKVAKSKIQGPIVVLPPLLCRSSVVRVCCFEGSGRDSMAPSRDPKTTSLVLVLSDRGYVVPIVRADAIQVVSKRLEHLYRIRGRCPVRHLVEAATGANAYT